MGSWGVHTFQNDTACDWVYDLEDSQGLALIEESLDAAINQRDYLEADEACFALAAAETVACLNGNPPDKALLTDGLKEWLSENNSSGVDLALLKKAQAAVDRVSKPPSELLELWSETELFEDWSNSLTDLRRRLLN